ncbi:Forkhead box protein J2, partial [Coemansia sp. RSA 2703]
MNSEFSTPAMSQQHSPVLMNTQHSRQQQQQPQHLNIAAATPACTDLSLGPYPAPVAFNIGHPHMEISTPTTAVDINSAHFAYLKDTFSARSYSPSTMDFAGMNIASGFHTPLSATPVAISQHQSQMTAQSDTASQSDISGDATNTVSESAAEGASGDVITASGSAVAPSSDKPDFSYASLIAQSLEDAPNHRRTLNGIYEWIQENFPYYRTRQNWQ